MLRRFNIFIPAISASHCPDSPLVLSSGFLVLWMRDRIVGMIPSKRNSGQHHRWLLTIAWVHSKNHAITFHCAPDLVPKSCKSLIMKRVCTRWGWSGESMEQHQGSAILSCSRVSRSYVRSRNGKVERSIGVLKTLARVILEDSKLHASYWSCAI